MKKRTRRIFFYSGVLLFFILGYGALLYAQGYGYSFSEKKIQRTGAISLKANTDAKVFLDDELDGTTSFLGNSYSVDRLLPGQYVIRLQRDGYSSWKKTATVTEGMLTDFPRALILPQTEAETEELKADIELALTAPEVILAPTATPKPKVKPKATPIPSATPETSSEPVMFLEGKLVFNSATEPVLLADNAHGFSLSEDKTKVAWWTNHELWVYWIRDTGYQPFHKAGDKELITRFLAPIVRIGWFADNDHVVVDANGYRITEIDTRGGINIIKI